MIFFKQFKFLGWEAINRVSPSFFIGFFEKRSINMNKKRRILLKLAIYFFKRYSASRLMLFGFAILAMLTVTW